MVLSILPKGKEGEMKNVKLAIYGICMLFILFLGYLGIRSIYRAGKNDCELAHSQAQQQANHTIQTTTQNITQQVIAADTATIRAWLLKNRKRAE